MARGITGGGSLARRTNPGTQSSLGSRERQDARMARGNTGGRAGKGRTNYRLSLRPSAPQRTLRRGGDGRTSDVVEAYAV